MADFVLDAFVATAWCFKDEATSYTDGILRALSGMAEAIAPRLRAYEVRNRVLMGTRRQRMTKADAADFIASLTDFRIRLCDPPSYDALFVLSDRYALTVYDAAYLDPAMRESLPLASLDKRLVRGAEVAGVVLFQL